MRNVFMTMSCALALVTNGGVGLRADDKAGVEKELKKFHGDWSFESVEVGGQKAPADQFKGVTITFTGDTYAVKKGDEVLQGGRQKLDPSKTPKAIDVTITEGPNKGAVMLGIYEIDAETFKVCFDEEGKQRPKEFKSPPGSQTFVNVHKRVKK
jgi:uncharacterized protein (TIGR03067 family)